MVSREFLQFRLVRSDQYIGLAAANNIGFRRARGRYLILLDSDATIEGHSLRAAISRMDVLPEVGLAGARQLDFRGTDHSRPLRFPTPIGDFFNTSGLTRAYPNALGASPATATQQDTPAAVEIDWVAGAFAIIRRSALESVGAFDERFFLYYGEIDFCRRLKQYGWKVWYWPDIVVRSTGRLGLADGAAGPAPIVNSELSLSRMCSALLYYRKHHGRFGAWLHARIQTGRHALRRLKARIVGGPGAIADESEQLIRLMRRAWTDTEGGMVSPPRPW
jgi:N-acetylglucosaminyl-diphospho-decaprenol L-rhamnosyltransferase